mgnify:CR=1 FL=1|tara:strand:+ start:1951 stop:2112 length:162 start_codon:yes stop_codon:yes gene_type:complete
MTEETKPAAKKPVAKKYVALKNLALNNNKQIKKGCTFTCTDDQAEKFKNNKAI